MSWLIKKMIGMIKSRGGTLGRLLLGILLALMFTGTALASPERVVVTSSVTYRADGGGAYSFKGNARLNGTGIASDGCVEYLDSPGTYELTLPYKVNDLISELTINWKFSGRVTMEVSATGISRDYVKVTNGVPLKWGDFSGGTDLKWRATLAPGSSLSEVKIDYADISGKNTGWGTPELSGFKFRKPIYIKGQSPPATDASAGRSGTVPGSSGEELFNYQIPIKIGESDKAGDYDVTLKNQTQSDFLDVCFTQADKETLLSFYRESVAGNAPDRVATFWVKLPQLPKEGLQIYLYYGKPDAADLSNGFETFDFFDDFKAQTPISYKLKDGIIEYRAKAEPNSKVGVIVKGDDSIAEDKNLKVFSSDITDEQHSIYKGKDKKINALGAISIGAFYNYRATSNAETLTYQRFNDDWTQMLAGVEYSDPAGLIQGYIGIAEGVIASPEGAKQSFAWLRVRQLADPKPQIDITKTESALVEIPNLANFSNCIVAGNGDLVLSSQNTEAEYLSPMIYSTLPIRIMVPSWKAATPDTSSVAADISATGATGDFKKSCISENYYYASRKDFKVGTSLCWKARLKRQSISAAASRLQEFSLDYRPGIITLVKPDGKEIIKAGANYEIDWSAWEYEPSYKMKLEYSLDGGKNYNLITKDADNDGHYLWGVPNKLTESAIVKISDTLEPTIYDVSNATFSIAKEGDSVSLPGAAGAEAISLDLERVLAAAKAAAKITAVNPEAESQAKRSLTEGNEAISQITAEEEKAKQRAGKQLYELVIMPRDNTLADPEEDKGSYKKGDVVVIVPAGHIWSETEKNSFLIVQAYLTQKEVNELMRPKEISRSKDVHDRTIIERVGRRNFRLDLKKQGLVLEKGKQLPKDMPLLKTEAIGEK